MLKSLLRRFRDWFLLPLASLSSRASREMVYLGDHRALTRLFSGQKLFVDTRDLSLTPHLLLEGYWEMWITQLLLSRVQEGKVVLEIGANVGYYTLLLASRVGPSGKVYAFEANPNTWDLTYQNLEINGLLDRVVLENKAVYSKTQTLKFSCFVRHHGSSTIIPVTNESAKTWHDAIEVIEVEGVSMDDYFGESIPKIDLIKIDAEGSESHIFKGMQRLLQANPTVEIVFEFLPSSIQGTGEDPAQMLALLQSYGFQFHRICDDSSLKPMTADQLLTLTSCEVLARR